MVSGQPTAYCVLLLRPVRFSPILANMHDQGKARFEYATDTEVVDALKLTMRMEGIIPALESCHAFAGAFANLFS